MRWTASLLLALVGLLDSGAGAPARSLRRRASEGELSADEEYDACAESSEMCLQLLKMQAPASTGAEFWSEILVEHGALYVSLTDGLAGTAQEEPIFHAHIDGSTTPVRVGALGANSSTDPPKQIWSETMVEAGFELGVDIEGLIMLAAAQAGLAELPRFTLENLQTVDWVVEVQKLFPPVRMRDCALIRFPWHAKAKDLLAEGEEHLPSLTLHPGAAFGTGEHPTTQLCCSALQAALETEELAGCEVLDFGSGSGVLAFVALLYGAGRAVGVEVDPNAIEVAQRNAIQNGMEGRTDFFRLGEEEEGRAYPLVVANILASTLIELEPLLAERVSLGGTLLLSGIWGGDQAIKVIDHYDENFEVLGLTQEKGWQCIRLERRGLNPAFEDMGRRRLVAAHAHKPLTAAGLESVVSAFMAVARQSEPGSPAVWIDLARLDARQRFAQGGAALASAPATLRCESEAAAGVRATGNRALAAERGGVIGDDAWMAEWYNRFSCWWLALPGPNQLALGDCMSALALSVSSAFDAFVGTSRRPQPALATEPGCKWLEVRELEGFPDFPAFPAAPHEFRLPPIPRLVPSWEQLRALSLAHGPHQSASARPAPTEQNGWLAQMSAGAAMGAGGALLALAAVHFGCVPVTSGTTGWCRR